MPDKLSWRWAITAACLVHCLLFAGMGWLSGKIFAASQVTEYMEMELVSDQAASGQRSGLAAGDAAAAPAGYPPAAHQPPAARMPASAERPVSGDMIADSFGPDQSIAVTASGNYAAGSSGGSEGGYGGSGSPGGAGGSDGYDDGAGSAPPGPKIITAPRILSKVGPVYPEEARRDGIRGSVGVKIEVLENGRPGEIEVQRSSGYDSLDEAALRAVRKWRFVPAQEADSGRAMRCFTTLTVVFRLN
ncbi:MAG TPA: hypothetical protein DEA44_15850 [Firmicutes bacterium]|nr:hypothetical protein [Bacillota bacterium]